MVRRNEQSRGNENRENQTLVEQINKLENSLNSTWNVNGASEEIILNNSENLTVFFNKLVELDANLLDVNSDWYAKFYTLNDKINLADEEGMPFLLDEDDISALGTNKKIVESILNISNKEEHLPYEDQLIKEKQDLVKAIQNYQDILLRELSSFKDLAVKYSKETALKMDLERIKQQKIDLERSKTQEAEGDLEDIRKTRADMALLLRMSGGEGEHEDSKKIDDLEKMLENLKKDENVDFESFQARLEEIRKQKETLKKKVEDILWIEGGNRLTADAKFGKKEFEDMNDETKKAFLSEAVSKVNFLKYYLIEKNLIKNLPDKQPKKKKKKKGEEETEVSEVLTQQIASEVLENLESEINEMEEGDLTSEKQAEIEDEINTLTRALLEKSITPEQRGEVESLSKGDYVYLHDTLFVVGGVDASESQVDSELVYSKVGHGKGMDKKFDFDDLALEMDDHGGEFIKKGSTNHETIKEFLLLNKGDRLKAKQRDGRMSDVVISEKNKEKIFFEIGEKTHTADLYGLAVGQIEEHKYLIIKAGDREGLRKQKKRGEVEQEQTPHQKVTDRFSKLFAQIERNQAEINNLPDKLVENLNSELEEMPVINTRIPENSDERGYSPSLIDVKKDKASYVLENAYQEAIALWFGELNENPSDEASLKKLEDLEGKTKKSIAELKDYVINNSVKDSRVEEGWETGKETELSEVISERVGILKSKLERLKQEKTRLERYQQGLREELGNLDASKMEGVKRKREIEKILKETDGYLEDKNLFGSILEDQNRINKILELLEDPSLGRSKTVRLDSVKFKSNKDVKITDALGEIKKLDKEIDITLRNVKSIFSSEIKDNPFEQIAFDKMWEDFKNKMLEFAPPKVKEEFDKLFGADEKDLDKIDLGWKKGLESILKHKDFTELKRWTTEFLAKFDLSLDNLKEENKEDSSKEVLIGYLKSFRDMPKGLLDGLTDWAVDKVFLRVFNLLPEKIKNKFKGEPDFTKEKDRKKLLEELRVVAEETKKDTIDNRKKDKEDGLGLPRSTSDLLQAGENQYTAGPKPGVMVGPTKDGDLKGPVRFRDWRTMKVKESNDLVSEIMAKDKKFRQMADILEGQMERVQKAEGGELDLGLSLPLEYLRKLDDYVYKHEEIFDDEGIKNRIEVLNLSLRELLEGLDKKVFEEGWLGYDKKIEKSSAGLAKQAEDTLNHIRILIGEGKKEENLSNEKINDFIAKLNKRFSKGSTDAKYKRVVDLFESVADNRDVLDISPVLGLAFSEIKVELSNLIQKKDYTNLDTFAKLMEGFENKKVKVEFAKDLEFQTSGWSKFGKDILHQIMRGGEYVYLSNEQYTEKNKDKKEKGPRDGFEFNFDLPDTKDKELNSEAEELKKEWQDILAMDFSIDEKSKEYRKELLKGFLVNVNNFAEKLKVASKNILDEDFDSQTKEYLDDLQKNFRSGKLNKKEKEFVEKNKEDLTPQEMVRFMDEVRETLENRSEFYEVYEDFVNGLSEKKKTALVDLGKVPESAEIKKMRKLWDRGQKDFNTNFLNRFIEKFNYYYDLDNLGNFEQSKRERREIIENIFDKEDWKYVLASLNNNPQDYGIKESNVIKKIGEIHKSYKNFKDGSTKYSREYFLDYIKEELRPQIEELKKIYETEEIEEAVSEPETATEPVESVEPGPEDAEERERSEGEEAILEAMFENFETESPSEPPVADVLAEIEADDADDELNAFEGEVGEEGVFGEVVKDIKEDEDSGKKKEDKDLIGDDKDVESEDEKDGEKEIKELAGKLKDIFKTPEEMIKTYKKKNVGLYRKISGLKESAKRVNYSKLGEIKTFGKETNKLNVEDSDLKDNDNNFIDDVFYNISNNTEISNGWEKFLPVFLKSYKSDDAGDHIKAFAKNVIKRGELFDKVESISKEVEKIKKTK